MDSDSVPGDRDSVSLPDRVLDRVLGDSVSQQQGWIRVYGKRRGTHRGGDMPGPGGGAEVRVDQVQFRPLGPSEPEGSGKSESRVQSPGPGPGVSRG